MEIEYRRDLNKRYMVLYTDASSTGYEIEMLKQNKLEGLLSMESRVLDGKIQYWYDITGMQSLDSYLEKKEVDYGLIKKLLLDIYQIGENLKPYLIPVNGLKLQCSMMFYDYEKGRLHLCYCPEEVEELEDALVDLFDFLLLKLSHENTEEVAACYKLYENCKQEGISFGEIVKSMQYSGPKEVQYWDDWAKEKEIGENQWLEQEEVLDKEEQSILKQLLSRFRRKKKKEDLGNPMGRSVEDFLYPLEEEAMTRQATERIDGCREQIRGEFHYVGKGMEMDFCIAKTPFLIGTKEDLADVCMTSLSVSRVHAKVLEEDGVYYIEDMNSTNGTFVNGEEVNYKSPVVLSPRDRVFFADQEFVFY